MLYNTNELKILFFKNLTILDDLNPTSVRFEFAFADHTKILQQQFTGLSFCLGGPQVAQLQVLYNVGYERRKLRVEYLQM